MTIQYSLLIDIGGTDIKVGVVEANKSLLIRVDRYPTPSFLDLVGYRREISPEELLLQCALAISNAKRSFGSFVSVALSGQMGCWVLTDENNNPVTKIVSWQDKRAEEISTQGRSFLELGIQAYGGESVRLAGNEVRPGLPIFGIYHQTRQGKAKKKLRFHSLISWLSSKLTDNYQFIVHETDFASSGMFNLETRKIIEGVEGLFNGEVVFPEVTDEYMFQGKLKGSEAKVFIGVGDQQASLHGAGLMENTVVVNIGTGGQVASLLPKDILNPNSQMRPYFDGQLIQTVTHLPAGRALTAYIKKLNPDNVQQLDYKPLFNFKIIEIEQIGIRDVVNFEKDLSNLSKTLSNEDQVILLQEVVCGFFRTYAEAIRKLNYANSKMLIFAGGVGQKFCTLQDLLGEEFKIPILIAETEESTLQGLAFLLAREE